MYIPPKVPLLAKLAMSGAVITIGMGVVTFSKHQNELRSSAWLKTVREKLNDHPGVKVLIGEQPVQFGTITRRKPSYELATKEIEPAPLHLITTSVKGDKGSGILYLWLNNPDKKKIESIDDWNLAHSELQIGNNRAKKIPLDVS